MKNIEEIKLSTGGSIEDLPTGQALAIRNTHQLFRKLVLADKVNYATLIKLELIYKRVDEARYQLKQLEGNPKAISNVYTRLFQQMHRLLNGAEDKAFNTFSWENAYRTERDLDRLEKRLFVFEQVIFWMEQELTA
jgi:hypothetical protein